MDSLEGLELGRIRCYRIVCCNDQMSMYRQTLAYSGSGLIIK